VPATSSRNTYATWETGNYAAMEAAPRYVELMGARVDITRMLPSSGTLSARRLLTRAFGGALSSSGTLPRQTTHKFLGTLTSSGLLQRGQAIRRTWAGALASSGALARVRRRVLAPTGVLVASGNLLLGLSRRIGITGLLVPTGSLEVVGRFYRTLQGALGLTGAFTRSKGWGKFLSGTLGTGGTFQIRRGIFPSGWLYSRGDMWAVIRYGPSPSGPPLQPGFPPEAAPPLVGAGSGSGHPLYAVMTEAAPSAGSRPSSPGRSLTPAPPQSAPPLRKR
jgi:hypothetical protein